MIVHRIIQCLVIVLTCCSANVCAAQESTQADSSFIEAIDLETLGHIAVYHDGRIKSFDSFSREIMNFVSGPRLINDQPRVFTYMDMIIRSSRYEQADVIYVKKKPVRGQIIDALRRSEQIEFHSAFQIRMDSFLETGLIAEDLLENDQVVLLLGQMSTDLIRTAKAVNQIENALVHRDPLRLLLLWKVVPPSTGGFDEPWLSMRDVMSDPQTNPLPTLNADDHRKLQDLWRNFVTAWLDEDASGVNKATAQLGALLPTINAELYPTSSRLEWESFYFRWKNMTWVWVFYLLTAIPLLLAIAFKWSGARWLGILMFLGTFALHTSAIGLRWYVAQRWPNSNMFEAVTTAAWFGGCGAIMLELFARRTAMRNVFYLGSAIASTVALMCAYYLPAQLNPAIGNMMPVLHDVWLYIHTNVIIFSYCVIFMAAVSGILYLIYRLIGSFMNWFGEMGGVEQYARVGGAGSLIMTRPDGGTYLETEKTTLGQVLDGTTMVLMELSFVLLWAGLVMGAIWADHSWGRPWGWDPKEVFALNTFIIFAILVHVRLKVRDKGLWTALLAVIGMIVMLFNWIFINFFIVGLHSYA